jgi:hypothetical protein
MEAAAGDPDGQPMGAGSLTANRDLDNNKESQMMSFGSLENN